jgi:hypothetical protein
VQAWLSFLIGLAACGFWIVLGPIVSTSLPKLAGDSIGVGHREALALWSTVPMLCFYLLLLPVPGVLLGILGLKAGGYAKSQAGLGIGVSLLFGLPIVGFILLIILNSITGGLHGLVG